jgi:hypothetical protein
MSNFFILLFSSFVDIFSLSVNAHSGNKEGKKIGERKKIKMCFADVSAELDKEIEEDSS